LFRHAKALARRSDRVDLEAALRSWLARVPDRKPVSVTVDLGAVRQFCLFRRRSDPQAFVPDRTWAPQSTESHFLPHVLSVDDVGRVLDLTRTVRHPLRACMLRTLLLVLYCTGLRPGEAVRLTLADLDLRNRVFTIRESKGKTRIVPFGDDLAEIIKSYLRVRPTVDPSARSGPLFTRPDGSAVPINVASLGIQRLFRRAGLKPSKGRIGPRPYDLRQHAGFRIMPGSRVA
jgi:integrase